MRQRQYGSRKLGQLVGLILVVSCVTSNVLAQGQTCEDEGICTPPAVYQVSYEIPVSVKLTHATSDPANSILHNEALIQEEFDRINSEILDRWRAGGYAVPWQIRTPVEVVDLSGVPAATGFSTQSIISAAVADPDTFAYRSDAVNVYIVEQISGLPGTLGSALAPYPGDGGGGILIGQTAAVDVFDGCDFDVEAVSASTLLIHEMGHYFSLQHAQGPALHSCICFTEQVGDFPPCPTDPMDQFLPLAGTPACILSPVNGDCISIPPLSVCDSVPANSCPWMSTSSWHRKDCAPCDLDADLCSEPIFCPPAHTKVLPTDEELHHVNYELLTPEGSRSHLTTRFTRGDCTGTGGVSAPDATFLLNYLFLGGSTPGCLDACDVTDDGVLNQIDATFLLNHLFLGGPAPSAPYPGCGFEPTFDGLDCKTSTCP